MAVYIFLGLIFVIIFYIIIFRKELVELESKVKEAFNLMDDYFKKRWDIIPNFVDVVKEVIYTEEKCLIEIVSLRNSYDYDSFSLEEKIDNNEKISKNIREIISLTDNYPALKLKDSFINLKDEIIKMEENINNSKNSYNELALEFNKKLKEFPSNLIAKVLSFNEKRIFDTTINNDKDIDNNKDNEE